MKRAICCLLFLVLVVYAPAQTNIFFKKDLPKYSFFIKPKAEIKDSRQPGTLRIPFYTIRSLGDEGIHDPSLTKGYKKTEISRASIILGITATILSSVFSDQMHYTHPDNPAYNYPH